MISNATGFAAGVLCGRFPGRIGHLMTPDGMREPHAEAPWAMDNGVYGAWDKGRVWDEKPFYDALERYQHHAPLWAAVPDWVADRERTLELWGEHHAAVALFAPTAFVVQDGMQPRDVPENADVIFVGGTTSWKWRNLRTWTANFPRVHVGRVNTYKLLWQAHEAGAESCDGTGWFRGDRRQLAGLERYLNETMGERIKERPGTLPLFRNGVEPKGSSESDGLQVAGRSRLLDQPVETEQPLQTEPKR